MPRYHFHLHDGFRFLDPTGIELPDENAAIKHGKENAKGLATLYGRRPGHYIKITDENGKLIGRCDIPPDDK